MIYKKGVKSIVENNVTRLVEGLPIYHAHVFPRDDQPMTMIGSLDGSHDLLLILLS
jgi:hypothetical protein